MDYTLNEEAEAPHDADFGEHLNMSRTHTFRGKEPGSFVHLYMKRRGKKDPEALDKFHGIMEYHKYQKDHGNRDTATVHYHKEEPSSHHHVTANLDQEGNLSAIKHTEHFKKKAIFKDDFHEVDEGLNEMKKGPKCEECNGTGKVKVLMTGAHRYDECPACEGYGTEAPMKKSRREYSVVGNDGKSRVKVSVPIKEMKTFPGKALRSIAPKKIDLDPEVNDHSDGDWQKTDSLDKMKFKSILKYPDRYGNDDDYITSKSPGKKDLGPDVGYKAPMEKVKEDLVEGLEDKMQYAKENALHHRGRADHHESIADEIFDKDPEAHHVELADHHSKAARLHHKAADAFFRAHDHFSQGYNSRGEEAMEKGERHGDNAEDHEKEHGIHEEFEVDEGYHTIIDKNGKPLKVYVPTREDDDEENRRGHGRHEPEPKKKKVVTEAAPRWRKFRDSEDDEDNEHEDRKKAREEAGRRKRHDRESAMSEDVIDEISNKMVGRYLKHANRSQKDLDDGAANNYDFEDGDNDAYADRQAEKAVDHRDHMDKAKRRLRPSGSIKPTKGMYEDAIDEKHIGFKKLEGELSHEKGVKNPGALAAFIGRKKYGAKGMEKKAEANE